MVLNYLSIKPKKIINTVIQPRIYSENIKSIQITDDELSKFKNQKLIPAVKNITSNNGIRYTGDHCKNCTAKINCPEYTKYSSQLEYPLPLTNDQIARVLKLRKPQEDLFKYAKQEGSKRLNGGHTIQGFKLVRPIKHNKIKDKEGLIKKIKKNNIYKDRVLKSPSQLKKILTKEEYKLVEDRLYKEEAENEIAPIEDNRPAVAAKTEMFKK